MSTPQPRRAKAISSARNAAQLRSDDRRARPKKSLYVRRGRLATCVVCHPRAVAWQQVVAKAVFVDGPNDEPVGILGHSRFEPFDTGLFANVEQHDLFPARLLSPDSPSL